MDAAAAALEPRLPGDGSVTVERLRMDVGAIAVTGPGLRIVVDDAPDTERPAGASPDDLVVHQQDVQSVVNALWRGGAEAMQVMDQRIISTSAVRCVGNTLILQGRVYSPPFVITAVGDTEKMQAALDADPTVSVYREYVAQLGLGYEVTSAQETTVPAYAGQSQLQHAKAVR